jgi:hypothetical protein
MSNMIPENPTQSAGVLAPPYQIAPAKPIKIGPMITSQKTATSIPFLFMDGERNLTLKTAGWFLVRAFSRAVNGLCFCAFAVALSKPHKRHSGKMFQVIVKSSTSPSNVCAPYTKNRQYKSYFSCSNYLEARPPWYRSRIKI